MEYRPAGLDVNDGGKRMPLFPVMADLYSGNPLL